MLVSMRLDLKVICKRNHGFLGGVDQVRNVAMSSSGLRWMLGTCALGVG